MRESTLFKKRLCHRESHLYTNNYLKPEILTYRCDGGEKQQKLLIEVHKREAGGLKFVKPPQEKG